VSKNDPVMIMSKIL